jgi:hypothetical protein
MNDIFDYKNDKIMIKTDCLPIATINCPSPCRQSIGPPSSKTKDKVNRRRKNKKNIGRGLACKSIVRC